MKEKQWCNVGSPLGSWGGGRERERPQFMVIVYLSRRNAAMVKETNLFCDNSSEPCKLISMEFDSALKLEGVKLNKLANRQIESSTFKLKEIRIM